MKNKTKRIIGKIMLLAPMFYIYGAIIYYLGWKDGLSIIGVSVLLYGYLYLAVELSSTSKIRDSQNEN